MPKIVKKRASGVTFWARCSLAAVLGLGCAAPILAQPLPFAGRWLPDDRAAAPGSYALLTIEGETISWRGPDSSTPGCVQQFALKKEKPGAVYVDGRGKKFLAGVPGSIPTYLLTLRASTCGGLAEEVRISFPLVYDTRHIELIEYVGGKPVTSRRFRRK
jgi:hypothetical protein